MQHKIAQDVYLMLRVHEEGVERRVRTNLNVAHAFIEQAGGVSLAKDTVAWEAINQLTRQGRQAVLPKMLLGGAWLGQNRDGGKPSSLVHQLQSLLGGNCTIFQRMDQSGDMLGVSTNVRQDDGSRAVGAYIPATDPDGTANPVIKAALRGETFVGRAFVVNAWYTAAYEPIFDAQKQVVGLLCFGIKQECSPELRHGIMDVAAGQTGCVYLLAAPATREAAI